MTIDEFRALKAGDRIRHPMSESSGTIEYGTSHRGKISVTVRWDGGPREGDTLWTFGEQSTAWMHWALLAREEAE